MLRVSEPFLAEWQEIAATLPVGVQRLRFDRVESTGFIDELVFRLRAMVLTHRLEDRVIPVHVAEIVETEVMERREIEIPATRWDALRLAFGAPAHRINWLKSSWYETRTVKAFLETDTEVRIERRDVFPDALVRYPDALGRRVVRFEHWEDPND